MANHSPGPWSLAVGKHEVKVGFGSDANDIEIRLFADGDLDDEDYPSDLESIANARLIAAAPDMLAALTTIADTLQGGDKLESCEPWARKLIELARAAIAKAEPKGTR